MVSRSIFSKNHPWVNRDFHFDSEVSEDIVYHLSCGSFGDVKMNNNVYFLFGFASRGYLEIEKKISEADEILSELDQIHGQNGYIIIHNGDGTYVDSDGKEIPSVTTIANHISEHIMPNGESVPVGFIQSDFGACLPGSDYWPPNASFGVFVPGRRHSYLKKKKGETVFDSEGNSVNAEAWGGYLYLNSNNESDCDRESRIVIDEISGQRMTSAVDAVLYEDLTLGKGDHLKEIKKNVVGHLVFAGGEITRDQIEIHNIGYHKGDRIIFGEDKDDIPSEINILGIKSLMRNQPFPGLWLSKNNEEKVCEDDVVLMLKSKPL